MITSKTDINPSQDRPIHADRDLEHEHECDYASERADRDPIHFLRRASWSAILAGTAVATVVQIMFTLLAIAFGMSMVDPRTESHPMSGVGMMVGVWTALGALVALFVGGWIAGRLAGTAEKFQTTLHGVVTWAVVTLIVCWTMTSAIGGVLNTATSALGSALRAAGQGISAVVPDNASLPAVSGQDARSTAQTFLQQMGISPQTVDRYLTSSRQQLGDAATAAATNPQQAYDEITTTLTNIAERGGDIAQTVSTQDAANVISKNTGLPPQKANELAQQWTQRIEQTNFKNQAGQMVNKMETGLAKAGDAVAGGISSAAAWTFVSILLGLIAAAVGGGLAAPKRGIPA